MIETLFGLILGIGTTFWFDRNVRSRPCLVVDLDYRGGRRDQNGVETNFTLLFTNRSSAAAFDVQVIDEPGVRSTFTGAVIARIPVGAHRNIEGLGKVVIQGSVHRLPTSAEVVPGVDLVRQQFDSLEGGFVLRYRNELGKWFRTRVIVAAGRANCSTPGLLRGTLPEQYQHA